MRWLALFTLLVLPGCGSIQRDENRQWAKAWNGTYCHRDDGTPYNCTEEEILEMAERSDYERTSRQLASTVNKNARSLPVTPLEREWMTFKIALKYMNQVQRALYAVEMNAATAPPGYSEKVMKGVPEARRKMNIFKRKLLELPSRHRFSSYLIARIEELNREEFSNAIQIERGALLWEFSYGNALSSADHYFLLDDLREDAEGTYAEKQGGRAALAARTVCTGLLLCAGGFSGEDETTISEMQTRIGIKIIYKGHYGVVPGLKPI